MTLPVAASSVKGSRREPRRHASMGPRVQGRRFGGRAGAPKAHYGSMGTPKRLLWCRCQRRPAECSIGAQPPCTPLTVDTLCQCASTERAAQQHTASQPAPSPSRILSREETDLALTMHIPNATRHERGVNSRRIIINETSRFRVRARHDRASDPSLETDETDRASPPTCSSPTASAASHYSCDQFSSVEGSRREP